MSSIDAFARTLAVHRRGIESALQEDREAEQATQSLIDDLHLLQTDLDPASDSPDDADDVVDPPRSNNQKILSTLLIMMKLRSMNC